MSHLVETLAYAGETPWHGLGTRLTGKADAQAMLALAGLDWTVESQPVVVNGAPVAGYQATVRVPQGNTLAILSEEYGIVQNQELADLAEAMAGAGVEAWEVAGSLDEGRRVFFSGYLGESEITIAGDRIRQYLTLASSHDGSLAVTAAFSPVRVVCANTLQMFLDDAGGRPRIGIRHTKTASDKVKTATKACEAARRYFGVFNDAAVALVGVRMTLEEAREGAGFVFPNYKNDAGEVVTPELQTTTVALFRGMPDSAHDQHIAFTRWGFYQAVTAALDHNRRGTKAARLGRFLSGSDDTIRSRAWRFLTSK